MMVTKPIISNPWPLNTPVATKTNPKMYIEINVIVNDGGNYFSLNVNLLS